MTSALRPAGSTKAWRKLRAAWAATLPTPCCRCGVVVNVGDAWDLDHLVPRAEGGADDRLGVSHAVCNRRAGRAWQRGRRLIVRPYRAPRW